MPCCLSQTHAGWALFDFYARGHLAGEIRAEVTKREDAQEADEASMDSEVNIDDLMVLVNVIVPFHMTVRSAPSCNVVRR